MILTPRFLIPFGLSTLFFVFAVLYTDLFLVGVAADGVLVACALYDFLRAPRPRDVGLERRCLTLFSHGAANPIEIRIVNRGPRRLRLVVTDSPPVEFAETGRRQPVAVAPFGEASIRYDCFPTKRGDFSFGPIFVRARGPLDLAVRQWSVEASLDVRVFPNLANLQHLTLGLKKGSLHAVGLNLSRFLGRGLEFERLREYAAGDDFRTIDWKATARHRAPVTREYETERRQRVVLMVDAGRLMTSRVDEFTKLDYAINAALLLAQAAAVKGDDVGLLVFGAQIQAYLPPRAGQSQVTAVSRALYSVQPEYVEANYEAAFGYLAAVNRRRSLLVCFTDLISREASALFIQRMRHAARHHLTMCVAIRDSAVEALARQSPSDIPGLYVITAAVEHLDDYEAALTTLGDTGSLVVSVPANRLAAAAVDRYLEAKQRGLL